MTDENGSIKGPHEPMTIEEVIAGHSRRSDDLEQFLTDIALAVKYLRFRLCTICGLTEPECTTRHMDHIYKSMTPVEFLLLTKRRHT